MTDEAMVRTRAVLTERRTALESLSQRLIEVEVVDADELQKIIDATLPAPRMVPGTSGKRPSDLKDAKDGQIIEPTPHGDVNPIGAGG